jgi:hypothetical protein
MRDTNDRSDTSDILVKTCARTPNTFRKKYNLELHDYLQPVYTRTPFQYVRQNERFLHHMPDLSMRMRMMIMDEREREREQYRSRRIETTVRNFLSDPPQEQPL